MIVDMIGLPCLIDPPSLPSIGFRRMPSQAKSHCHSVSYGLAHETNRQRALRRKSK